MKNSNLQNLDEVENNEQKQEDNEVTPYKVIVDKNKLTILELDNTNGVENKVYETNELCEEIKKLSKIRIKKIDVEFELVKNMKNGIFIIKSKQIATYGAFFCIKFNNTTKGIEIIGEDNQRIIFLTELSNGNFAYRCYLRRPLGTYDRLYIFDIQKNEKHYIIGFDDEYTRANWSNFACFPNGLVFSHTSADYQHKAHSYLVIIKGFEKKKENFDCFGKIKSIRYKNRNLYLLNESNKNIFMISKIL